MFSFSAISDKSDYISQKDNKSPNNLIIFITKPMEVLSKLPLFGKKLKKPVNMLNV
jgi:hypothetical protein